VQLKIFVLIKKKGDYQNSKWESNVRTLRDART